MTRKGPPDEPVAVRPGRYRHFKGGEYEVIGVARDSESDQEVVVYRALYGERGLWVRPLRMFTEIVEREGQRVRRFEFIGD
jgi:cyclomaltodextrinase